jgi:hypothetical protein
MCRLVVKPFVALDGIMQAPGAPDEDRSRAFTNATYQRAGDVQPGSFALERLAEHRVHSPRNGEPLHALLEAMAVDPPPVPDRI